MYAYILEHEELCFSAENEKKISHPPGNKTQLSARATLLVVRHFVKSLKMTQGHLKLRCCVWRV